MSANSLHRNLFQTALAVLALLCIGVMCGPAMAAQAKPSFFNTKEVHSTNLKPFSKWTGALSRYSKESALVKKTGCKAKEFTTCHYVQWRKFLGTLVGKDKLAQITAVNAYMNKAKYITDNNNWGKKDYWATPGEFMGRFGDCEDYAIAKFMSLILLGMNPNSLRVVAVKDLNLKVGHAILAVFVGGKTLILDNQISQVVEAKTIRHYKPVFSINQKSWWLHRAG